MKSETEILSKLKEMAVDENTTDEHLKSYNEALVWVLDIGNLLHTEKCLELTADLWNTWLDVLDKHPDDNDEMRRDIHNIQNRLYAKLYKELGRCNHCGANTENDES